MNTWTNGGGEPEAKEITYADMKLGFFDRSGPFPLWKVQNKMQWPKVCELRCVMRSLDKICGNKLCKWYERDDAAFETTGDSWAVGEMRGTIARWRMPHSYSSHRCTNEFHAFPIPVAPFPSYRWRSLHSEYCKEFNANKLQHSMVPCCCFDQRHSFLSFRGSFVSQARDANKSQRIIIATNHSLTHSTQTLRVLGVGGKFACVSFDRRLLRTNLFVCSLAGWHAQSALLSERNVCSYAANWPIPSSILICLMKLENNAHLKWKNDRNTSQILNIINDSTTVSRFASAAARACVECVRAHTNMVQSNFADFIALATVFFSCLLIFFFSPLFTISERARNHRSWQATLTARDLVVNLNWNERNHKNSFV